MTVSGLYDEIHNRLNEMKVQYEEEVAESNFVTIVDNWVRKHQTAAAEFDSDAPEPPVKKPEA